MKASALIAILAQRIADHGDCEVKIDIFNRLVPVTEVGSMLNDDDSADMHTICFDGEQFKNG